MIDSFVAFFVAHLNIIHISCGLLAAAGYAVLHHRRPDLRKVITSGFLGAGVPVGFLLILVAFRPDLTDKLRQFPLEICILGFLYIVFAVHKIRGIYKDPE